MEIDVDHIVTLDFETYYDDGEYTLSKMPTSEYVLDEKFIAHCVGVKIGYAPVKLYWYDDIRPALAEIDWSQNDLLAHNTAFDGFILSQRYQGHTRYAYDTLSMSRGVHGIGRSSNLATLAMRLGVGVKNSGVLHEARGYRVIPLEMREAFGQYCMNDVELCFLCFLKLAGLLTARERDMINLTLQMFLEPIFKLDLEMAQRVEQEERGGKLALLADYKITPDQLMSNPKFAELLHTIDPAIEIPMKLSPSDPEQLKEIYAFAKTDAGMQALINHDNKKIQKLARARLQYKSSIGESRAARLIQACSEGQRLPVLLNYCGAHTTRWSAGNKMNLQNIPKDGNLRKSIIAEDGYVIVVVDSSQIQARINAWISKQWDLLEDFKSNADPYSKFASKLYGRTITKANKTERFIGKTCVLGLGFGMGAEHLIASARNATPSVVLSFELADAAVTLFRMTNLEMTKFRQKTCEKIIRDMILLKEGKLEHYGPITWGNHKGDGWIELPNELRLHYEHIQAAYEGDGHWYLNRGAKTKIYGGYLCENIVQALERCIVADQMLDISRKYRTGTMSHDEIVCVVKEEEKDECLAYMLQVMKTSPAWALDLPLDAEGGYGKCYSK